MSRPASRVRLKRISGRAMLFVSRGYRSCTANQHEGLYIYIYCREEETDVSLAQLFVTPLHDYDILVRLRNTALPRYFQNITAPHGRHGKSKKKYKNIELGKMDEGAVAGFDPATILTDKITVRLLNRSRHNNHWNGWARFCTSV